MNGVEPGYFKLHEASGYCGLSVSKLRALIRAKQLPVLNMPGAPRIVPRKALDSLMMQFTAYGDKPITGQAAPPGGILEAARQFVSTHCLQGEMFRESARDLFQAFSRHYPDLARPNGLGRCLRFMGFKGTKGAQGRRLWAGLCLRSSIEPERH